MSDDNYLSLDFTDLTEPPPVSRRDFLKTLGGGIIIFISFGDLLFAQEHGGRRRFRPQAPADFNAFLRIGEDGRVTCFTGKIEMGQGVHTSLAQMIADELGAPLDSVNLIMGDTDLCPWDMGTFGSMTTRFFGPALRRAAAEARTVLIELAAERIGVPAERLKAEGGAVFEAGHRDRRVTYGELARGRRIERTVDGEAVLKTLAERTVMGKSTPRADARDKVTGRAQFAGDIRLPGMLYARILRPPAHGAGLESADTSAAEKVEGVRVLEDGDLVAVLHETPDGAERALAAVEARFTTPDATLNDGNIFEHLLRVSPAGDVLAANGELEEGEKLAAHVVEGTYLDGYVAHAPIETHTAVARVEDDQATIWASTQTPFRARESVARALELPASKVRVITPFVGGGFGGKGQNPQVVEAARLARLAGRPVHLEWTRAEEFFFDSFRPAAIVKLRSGVTKEGRIAFWDYAVHFAGRRGAQHFYDIPCHRTVAHGSGWRGTPGSHPFRTGAWRAPANNTNTFARESQIDRMATVAGVDPLELRLRHLKDERMRRVLEAAARKFGWKPSKGPSGRGVGIACGVDAGSYVAHIAKVGVDRGTGRVQVERVVCAQDMGQVINPDGARMQIEGCITMGLGYALTEEIHFEGGKIHERNFDSYELPRFSWVPAIDSVLIDAGDAPPQGCGEPAIVCMGALIANAVHDAVGVRLERLPMTPERILEAIRRKA